jgi:modulator of FtsH protease HflK
MDFGDSPFKGHIDPNDIINAGKKKLPDIARRMPYIVLGILALVLIISGLYSVGPDEVGVVRRFGRYVRITNPGLNIKIPFGVEKVNNVKVRYIYKEEFGFRTTRPGVVTRYSPRSFYEESLMLTGDLNVTVVEWIVQFQVRDPVKMLFNIRDPQDTIRNISEAVMRQVVGDYSVSEALTVRRVEINIAAKEKIQEILDSYNSGIQVVTVMLQDVNPPDPVKPSFNEVNEAKQEKEKVINQAWEEYNKAIPAARGNAEKTIREAEGYALNRINQAKGDASRFIATWQAYKEAKDVTKKRIFLEIMREIIPKAGKKYIIDPDQRGILPLLNLNEPQKR